MATHFATLKIWSVPTKILISQQQLIIEYLTWYKINSWTKQFDLVVGNANLISIFMTITENLRNERKFVEQLTGAPTKLPISTCYFL